MNDPLVSIIMPAYNAEKFIEESINSVIGQTFTNWELVIIDDGSIDNTADIVKRHAINDHRIKYFYQENGRQGKARNAGLKNSKGAFIAFLDADDLWLPDKLTIQVNELSSLSNIDLLFTQGYKIISGEPAAYDVLVKDLWDRKDLSHLIDYNQIPILSVLVKREILFAVNCFTEDHNIQNLEDYHLWLKLFINNYKFKSLAARTFLYRIHEDQNTFNNSNYIFQSFYTYKDIYYSFEDETVRKLIINKLKWMIFNEKLYLNILEIARFHFKNKGKRVISFILNSRLFSFKPLSQKLGFHLIKIYG
jgi:teichuronic acid biosynthesis glycosyltransferase TuaG